MSYIFETKQIRRDASCQPSLCHKKVSAQTKSKTAQSQYNYILFSSLPSVINNYVTTNLYRLYTQASHQHQPMLHPNPATRTPHRAFSEYTTEALYTSYKKRRESQPSNRLKISSYFIQKKVSTRNAHHHLVAGLALGAEAFLSQPQFFCFPLSKPLRNLLPSSSLTTTGSSIRWGYAW